MLGTWIVAALLLGASGAAIGFWLARRRQRSLESLRSRLVAVTQSSRQTGDNIAHDLRTPLTRLHADVETTLRVEDSEAHRATLERVLTEIQGMQNIISALLTLGQAEAGGMPVKKMVVDLSVLLEEILELYGPSAEERQLRLQGRVTPQILVEADRQLLARIFSNLLDNALKYVPADGLVVLSATAKGGEVVITVEDDGPGIPLEMRDKIFQRFTRLDSSRTLSGGAGGSGLGLSLVKAFAKLLQGDVRAAESSLGGAAFIVTLPAAAAGAPRPAP
ncbi:MAG TPA: HAMP domain-containing sensor histidine kinase [Sulfuricella sp.]|nr:HAMP domain-containing sensor histidine kinase [Sulfuricella sp.]